MRLAFDAAPLLNARTGVGQYSASLLEHLLAAEPTLGVTLFALGRQRGPAVLPEGAPQAVKRLGVPARYAVLAWEALGHPGAEAWLGPQDVVHGTNFWIPPLRRAGGVVTLHDLTFLVHPESCTPPVRRYRTIVPRVLRRTAVVLTPSQTVADQVAADLAFPEDRIVVTPEGVRPLGRPGTLPTGLPERYALFVGTREPRKNLDRLLQAFALLGDLDLGLVVVGGRGWGSGPDLAGRAAELGLGGRVTLCGFLADDQLAATLAGATLFAFPSIYEGFGLPPLEAMAAGIPVVAGRAGSLPEVLGDAPFWCDPLDVESIAAALRRAATDSEGRAGAIARGKAQAGRFDWHETARLTLGAYRQAMT